jgi:hypothetical protein
MPGQSSRCSKIGFPFTFEIADRGRRTCHNLESHVSVLLLIGANAIIRTQLAQEIGVVFSSTSGDETVFTVVAA